ncbi:hypothetical protein JCM31826_16210 [Thermaurantimonas aggregans]|uniref:DUF2452 domain-containing protein n=1 Tax=Thermaurantimonas aggregans TaxID=2173829 RepID=A0A401XM88_9FLAO|nr:DUF2452 domain-containing protein [Thermaurantimonas aggregans]MCX8148010.1 DUF2452 domain-containing protein [Thermaurantimonas aggregans]GCD78139.1 hypothetical protein JCM31826_16210 [Thermaurantimonas aggregans]
MAEEFKNPIDADKVAEKPSTLPYAHHVGSAVIKPLDLGKTIGRAVAAMEHQTDLQLAQIKEQVELLMRQADAIQQRKKLAHIIYSCEIRFRPEINHIYHLYQRPDGSHMLSMIGPNEWGRSKTPGSYVYSVKLLADHTWEIVQ